MKKLKAFTIIELTIVIVIIWILMAATMKFSGDRIGILNNKNIQEQFLDSFLALQSQNNMTNYYSWKIYETLKINFILENDHFNYSYHNSYDDSTIDTLTAIVEWWKYKISEIMLDGKGEFSEVDVLMQPYTLWCKITNNDGSLSWKNLKLWILVNDTKEYCFSVESNNCKIKTISCLSY